MKILATKPAADGKGFAKLELDDGTEVEAWTPELDKVLALGAGPIPGDWVLRDGPRGKQLLPPKQGRGGSYAQSKEAFDRSADSRREWQLLEEDRKDRRTALMTALEHPEVWGAGEPVNGALEAVQRLYGWLRDPDRDREARSEGDPGESVAYGEGARGTSDPPTPAGGGVPSPSSPPARRYPADPLECSHRFPSGSWLPWDEGDRCPKCGTPRIAAMEGTTVDLGGP